GLEQNDAAENGGAGAREQKPAVADSGQEANRRQATHQQRQPVDGQQRERQFRADAQPVDQENGQPSGDGPFVAELEEQQQGEQDGAGAAEVAKKLRDAGLVDNQRGWERTA